TERALSWHEGSFKTRARNSDAEFAGLREPGGEELRVGLAEGHVLSAAFGIAPTPNSGAHEACTAACIQGLFEGVARMRRIRGRQFAEPKRRFQVSQRGELLAEGMFLIRFCLWIVMRLQKVQIDFGPGTDPEQTCGAESHRHMRC